jgi:hypothetical protein
MAGSGKITRNPIPGLVMLSPFEQDGPQPWRVLPGRLPHRRVTTTQIYDMHRRSESESVSHDVRVQGPRRVAGFEIMGGVKGIQRKAL